MTVESQDLWGRMWGPKPPHNSTNMIINIKYGYGGGDEVRHLTVHLSSKIFVILFIISALLTLFVQ